MDRMDRWGIEGDIVKAGSIIGDREWRGGRRIKRGWGIEGVNSKVERSRDIEGTGGID